ncbi:MAG: hypothetical protein RIQ56_838 [Candidatus Parcubacteria bacterium]|jgi:hypothetical protein
MAQEIWHAPDPRNFRILREIMRIIRDAADSRRVEMRRGGGWGDPQFTFKLGGEKIVMTVLLVESMILVGNQVFFGLHLPQGLPGVLESLKK